jgi:DNA topoisomerase-6 subunit B
VYRGNPFQMEVAIAFGGELKSEESARILRFANRVPLLYQQSACSSFKAVVETGWKNYSLQQPRGALPVGPLVIMIHMASVWVPFTSESKEAIADYDEIRKEMRLALQECGRKLGIYLRRKQRMKKESERRSIFERYIGEISTACNAITGVDSEKLYAALLKQAAKKTAEADQLLDDEGKVIDEGGRLAKDADVIILDDRKAASGGSNDDTDLFGDRTKKKVRRKSAAKKKSRTKKKARR